MSSHKPKQTNRKRPRHLNHSPVKVGSATQQDSETDSTRTCCWGQRNRVNDHIELASDAGSFAPYESCQLPDFAADSGHFHQEPAEGTKRLPDIVHRRLPNRMGDRRERLPYPTGDCLSVAGCVEFTLNIESVKRPRAFVSSLLGAPCWRRRRRSIFLSGVLVPVVKYRRGRTAKLSPFHAYCAKTEPSSVHYCRQRRGVQHRLNLCFSVQRVAHLLHHL